LIKKPPLSLPEKCLTSAWKPSQTLKAGPHPGHPLPAPAAASATALVKAGPHPGQPLPAPAAASATALAAAAAAAAAGTQKG